VRRSAAEYRYESALVLDTEWLGPEECVAAVMRWGNLRGA
jgi:hypothetical protein